MNDPATFAEAIADTPTIDLAALARVSGQAVQAWKRGDALPAVALVPKIAQRLGMPTDKLAGIVARDAERKKAAR